MKYFRTRFFHSESGNKVLPGVTLAQFLFVLVAASVALSWHTLCVTAETTTPPDWATLESNGKRVEDKVNGVLGPMMSKIINSLPTPVYLIKNLTFDDLMDRNTIRETQKYIEVVVGYSCPGFVLAVLVVLLGILFLCMRLCCGRCFTRCFTCCYRGQPSKSRFSICDKITPIVLVVLFAVCIAAGAVIGFVNSARFSVYLNDVTTETDDAFDELFFSVSDMTDFIAVEDVVFVAQANEVLSITYGYPTVVEETSSAYQLMTTQDLQLDQTDTILGGLVGFTDSIQNYTATVEQLLNMSSFAVSQQTSFYYQLLRQIGKVRQYAVIASQGTSIMNEATDVVSQSNKTRNDIHSYTKDASTADKIRAAVLNALFLVPLIIFCFLALGILLKFGWSFKIGIGIAFLLLTILFILAGFHVLVALVVSDLCEVYNVQVLPNDIGKVIDGCHSGQTLLEIGTDAKVHYTDYMPIQGYVDNFLRYENVSFDPEATISYCETVINAYYNFNYTAESFQVTPENVGYSATTFDDLKQSMDDLISTLNSQCSSYCTDTCDQYFTIQNYTLCDPSHYGTGEDTVRNTTRQLDTVVALNTTVTNKLLLFILQLQAMQTLWDDIFQEAVVMYVGYDVMLLDLITFSDNLTAIKAITDNITAADAELDAITNCSFLSVYYDNSLQYICYDMLAAGELVMLALWVMAIFSVPIIIVSIMTAQRFQRRTTRVAPKETGDNKDTVEEGKVEEKEGKEAAGGEAKKAEK